MLPIQILQKKHILAVANTKTRKSYENGEDILVPYGKYTLSIGKVSQSVVESSNGSTISLNGCQSQCV